MRDEIAETGRLKKKVAQLDWESPRETSIPHAVTTVVGQSSDIRRCIPRADRGLLRTGAAVHSFRQDEWQRCTATTTGSRQAVGLIATVQTTQVRYVRAIRPQGRRLRTHQPSPRQHDLPEMMEDARVHLELARRRPAAGLSGTERGRFSHTRGSVYERTFSLAAG